LPRKMRWRVADRVAAGIGAHRLDPDELAAEYLIRSRRDRGSRPADELLGKAAAHRAEPRHRHADVDQLHRADYLAPAAEIAIGQRRIAHVFARQIGETCLGVAAGGEIERDRRRAHAAAEHATGEQEGSEGDQALHARHCRATWLTIGKCARLDAPPEFSTPVDGPRGPNAARALCKERLT